MQQTLKKPALFAWGDLMNILGILVIFAVLAIDIIFFVAILLDL